MFYISFTNFVNNFFPAKDTSISLHDFLIFPDFVGLKFFVHHFVVGLKCSAAVLRLLLLFLWLFCFLEINLHLFLGRFHCLCSPLNVGLPTF